MPSSAPTSAHEEVATGEILASLPSREVASVLWNVARMLQPEDFLRLTSSA
jgi:hypothetical protein